MARDKLPFLQFYPSDWIQDTQVLTLDAQGAWIKIICGLHVSPTYGKRTWTRDELRVFLNIHEQYDAELSDLLGQLQRVADIDALDQEGNEVENFTDAEEITITCRRMLRDIERINARKDSYKKYNDKRTTPKPQKNHRQKSDTKNKRESSYKNKKDSLSSSSDDQSESVSVKELIESWNETFKDKLPSVEWPLSKSRFQKVRARLSEHSAVEFWNKVFTNIQNSNFLLGRVNGSWRCTLDFVIANDSNCLKIYEGGYK